MVFSGKETGTLFPALPRMLFLHFQHPREGSSCPIPFSPGGAWRRHIRSAAATPHVPGDSGKLYRQSAQCKPAPAIRKERSRMQGKHPAREKGIGNEESKPPRELRNICSSLFNIYCRAQVFKPFDKKISIFIYFIDIPPLSGLPTAGARPHYPAYFTT